MAINDNQGDLGHLMRGAIRWQSGGNQVALSVAGHQEAIKKRQSDAIRCNPMQSDAIRCNQMHSDAIRCTQRHSPFHVGSGWMGEIQSDALRYNPMHSEALTFPRRLWMDGRRLRQRRRRVDLHTHHHLAKIGAFGHYAPSRSVGWVAHEAVLLRT